VIDEDPRVIPIALKNQTYGDKIKVSGASPIQNTIGLGTIKGRKSYTIMAEPYSKTEVDSKLDLVNQKIEHNQEKMELIVSKAMDNISYQITSLDKNLDTSVKLLEKQIDSKLSKIESKALYYVVGSLLVPIVLVAAPFTLKILLTMLNTLTGH
jgi:hypothetical protein